MNHHKTTNNSRRLFIKKVAYVAPAFVALGALSAPTNANASYIHVAQVNNITADRTAEIYQENDGSDYVKTVEDAKDETNVFTEESSFTTWLRNFFS